VSARARSLKVGIFVLVALILSTLIVFTIGDNRRAWERKVTFRAAYEDVVGLRPGSIVRLGGIDIGTVEAVEHGDDPSDNKVYVTMSVARAEAVRVRAATVAAIEGKGLLGDKMVQLVWDPRLAEEMRKQGKDPLALVSPGGTLETKSPGDPFGDAQRAAQGAKLAMENLQRATEGIADDRFKEDIHGTTKALREILEGISQRDGVAHRLIFDPDEAKRMDRTLANLEQASANVARLTGDIRDVGERVKSGPGLAHAIFYDPELARGLTGALVELHQGLEAVRTRQGVAHAMIYGDERLDRVVSNAATVSDDVRHMVEGMKAGRGTVGALLVDPSVYEDVKNLIGNVERNQILRALVRFSIRQDEDRPHAEVSPR
jgi:phospholipid/cholesterol/gamma-HCH transport system substrate-binding protein